MTDLKQKNAASPIIGALDYNPAQGVILSDKEEKYIDKCVGSS